MGCLLLPSKDGGQCVLNILLAQDDLITTRNFATQNANSIKIEKPWSSTMFRTPLNMILFVK